MKPWSCSRAGVLLAKTENLSRWAWRTWRWAGRQAGTEGEVQVQGLGEVLEVLELGTGWLVGPAKFSAGHRFKVHTSYLSPLGTGASVLEHVGRNLPPRTDQH